MASGRLILDRGKLMLLKNIMEEMPGELELSSIEFEGPFIVIYVKNRSALIKYPLLAQNIAKKVRKRIVIRVSPDARLPPEEARKKIIEYSPKEAGLDPNGIFFDEASGEVIVKAEKPGHLIGKNNMFRNVLLAETGWRVIPLRITPFESKTLREVNSVLLKQNTYRLDFLRSLGERVHRDVIYRNNYVRLTALGGFREVGRSAIFVETRESKILLDFGINVGALSDPNKAYPIIDALKIDELDGIVVTHAHLDHVGLVPLLYKYGYRGPVYVTKPTRELMSIMLKDLIEVSKKSGRYLPYGEKDIVSTLLHTITVDYEEVTDVAPDIKLTMYDAGHLLGSAIIHLHIGMGLYNIVYTGDFKYADSRLLNKAHTSFPRAEALIMESTYGATLQESRTLAEARLVEIAKRVIERGGVILIPVFAAGRGQEMLLILNNAMEQGLIPRVNIYVEGLVNEVTAIHMQYPECLSKKVKEEIYNGENPFISDSVKIIEGPVARPDIVEDRPSIIIATNGMLNGGPAVDYFRLLANDPRNAIVFVGYQAEGTLGRAVKDGVKEIPVVVENKVEVVKVQMEVYSIDGFSGHSDQRELLTYVKDLNPKPKVVILKHGEENAIEALATLLKKTREIRQFVQHIYAPSNLDSINLTAI
ncbi:MAG: beta-CASP ribonuclease aCPSF1 [Desulfurococcaceae archaeon]